MQLWYVNDTCIFIHVSHAYIVVDTSSATYKRLHYKYPFSFVQSCWDIEDTDEMKQKIWKIAQQRYKGWRATFSATYKAFNTYDERMKNRPEDLDIVEWHYLIKYFGSMKFKVQHYFTNLITESSIQIYIDKHYLFAGCS